MKKFLMALFIVAVATSVSMAGVRIDWNTGWGGFDHTAGANPVSGNNLLDGYGAIWQLIFAGADNAIDPIDDQLAPVDPTAWAANNYLRPGGDDVLLGQRIIPMGGGAATGGMANDTPTTWDNTMYLALGFTTLEDLSWSTAGFIYQRVFEGTPGNLSYFYETGLLALNTSFVAGDGLVAQSFFVDGTAPNYDSVNSGFSPQSQVATTTPVPEPATMGLLGLGALVMAIRRRRS